MSNLSLSDVIELNAIRSFKEALDLGADINGVDENGWSALHKASRGGYKKMVVFLLEHHADRLIKDKSGYDALFYALAEGHTEIALMLQANHG